MKMICFYYNCRYFNEKICRKDQGGAEDAEMGWLFYSSKN